MTIQVTCPNGHKLAAQDKLAGKQVKCPKCQSVIRIPARAEFVEVLPELVEEEPLPATNDMADPASIDFSNEGANPSFDPFGQTANSQYANDPFGEAVMDSAFSQTGPQSYGSYRPASPVSAKVSQEPTSNNWAVFIGAATVGLFCGLSFVGLLGWMLFPRSSKNGISQAIPAPTDVAAQPTPAVTPTVVTPPAQTPPVEIPTPSSSKETTVASTDLRRIELDERLMGFDLPGLTWASAYDETSGHLVVTNDEKGILIYDLDDVLHGKTAIKSVLPTEGIPTAVCLKQFEDKRVFVIAGKNSANLQLIDANSLEQLKKIPLVNVSYVDFLTASVNPKDPYVYFSTANESPVSGEVTGLLGRVDALTGKQDGFSKSPFIDAALSADGTTIYARMATYNGTYVRVGSWDEFLSLDESQLLRIRGGLGYGESVPYVFGNTVAIAQQLYTRSLSIKTAILDYVAGAEFRSRPVLLGIGKNGVFFGSANNGRRHDLAPLPPNWIRDKSASNSSGPSDFRERYGLSYAIKSGYCNILADEQRSLGLIVLGERFVVAPTDKFRIPNEPNLQPVDTLPQSVEEGEKLDLQLATADPNTVFEYVPNTDWLPNEKTPLLGKMSVGESSPRSLLRLARSLASGDDRIHLADIRQLGERKPPFKLRIRNEIIEVTGIEPDGTLMVVRTQSFIYPSDERIAVVDDWGTELDPQTTSAPISSDSKRIILSASINSNQDVIFVNSLEPLEGERFPIKIQIGDEVMAVVIVDDLKNQLIVERSQQVRHHVNSNAYVISNKLESPKVTENLPIVQNKNLKWTPASNQMGRQNIRLRARSGSVTRDWFWETEVTSRMVTFPFEVAGIEVEKGTSLAVVWGQSKFPIVPLQSNTTSVTEPDGIEYFVGVFDVANRKLLQHTKISNRVASAAIHNGQIVACLHNSKAELVRLNSQTLKETLRVDLPSLCNRLQVIGGKFVVGTLLNRKQELRFTFPELKAIEPTQLKYSYPISGRLRDGWVWDGVVWNEQMTKPRLLLYPVHFESNYRESLHGPGSLRNRQGYARTYPQGIVSAWFPSSAHSTGAYSLLSHSYPGGFECEGLQLKSISWAESSLATADGNQTKKSRRLVTDVEFERILRSKSFKVGSQDNPFALRDALPAGYMSEDEKSVHVALLGGVVTVNKNELFDAKEFFRFEEKQDTFVLSADKVNRFRYSAPGATNYQLHLWFTPQGHFDDPPNISLESRDGQFELEFDPQFVANQGMGILTSASSFVTKETLAAYAKKITPAYKQLTGKSPVTVCVPVYVLVLADHEDGKQKASLVHSYLVEVPAKLLQEKIQKR